MRNFQLRVKPSPHLKGEVAIPGDKSISHRAAMLSGIADGETHIKNFLESEDCLHTLSIMENMGVAVERSKNSSSLLVRGVGKYGLEAPHHPLDCGNSGTSMRLLMGLLSGQTFSSILVGDSSLQKRPMARVSAPLQQMGAEIHLTDDQFAPVSIFPSKKLVGLQYALPVASAQVKSAILLASLYAEGGTYLVEPTLTRDHTERMLESFGCKITHNRDQIVFPCGQNLRGTDITVPADLSSAAFFMVAAVIAEKSEILLRNIGNNPSRNHVIPLLLAMNANMRMYDQQNFGMEPVADFVFKSSNLSGIFFPQDWVPGAIDELPILMIACACAEGTSEIRNAKELRVKESDRIHAMVQGLKTLGVSVREYPDGVMIEGGKIKGGHVQSFGDHRIAMAFTVAAARAEDEIIISDCENIKTSFPQFIELAQNIGFNINIENGAA